MAPRAGTETRHQLSESVSDLKEKGAKLVEDVRETAGFQLGNVRENLGKKISLISEAIDAGRKAAGDARTPSEARPTTEETQGG